MKRKRFVKCARAKMLPLTFESYYTFTFNQIDKLIYFIFDDMKKEYKKDINPTCDRLLTMRTRSQTSAANDVIIDFDEASRAWRANKISLKNGCFAYVENDDDYKDTCFVSKERPVRVRRAPKHFQCS
jgi:hypothetical protein